MRKFHGDFSVCVCAHVCLCVNVQVSWQRLYIYLQSYNSRSLSYSLLSLLLAQHFCGIWKWVRVWFRWIAAIGQLWMGQYQFYRIVDRFDFWCARRVRGLQWTTVGTFFPKAVVVCENPYFAEKLFLCACVRKKNEKAWLNGIFRWKSVFCM